MSPKVGFCLARHGSKINWRWGGALALLLAGLLSRPGTAAIIAPGQNVTPRQWLVRAARAADKVSYRALETVRVSGSRRGQSQKINLSHVPDATRREYLDERGRVERIVGEGEHYNWQYLPAQKETIYSPALRIDQELWEERSLDRLFGNYEVTLLAPATLAGRICQGVSLLPRSGHLGPSKKLWVDKATGLVLQSELVSSDGATRITSELSNLQFQKNIPEQEFIPPASAKKQSILYEHMAVLPLSALAKQWRHRLLVIPQPPAGYYLESARLVKRGRQEFVHLRYFDGLNTLSLFQAPTGERKSASISALDKETVRGSATAWRYDPPFGSLSWSEAGVKLTLLGDLPKMELLRLARNTGAASK
jgi:negative regulator of sigma E activity